MSKVINTSTYVPLAGFADKLNTHIDKMNTDGWS